MLAKRDILSKQSDKIKKIVNSIGISETLSRALLMKFGWDEVTA